MLKKRGFFSEEFNLTEQRNADCKLSSMSILWITETNLRAFMRPAQTRLSLIVRQALNLKSLRDCNTSRLFQIGQNAPVNPHAHAQFFFVDTDEKLVAQRGGDEIGRASCRERVWMS